MCDNTEIILVHIPTVITDVYGEINVWYQLKKHYDSPSCVRVKGWSNHVTGRDDWIVLTRFCDPLVRQEKLDEVIRAIFRELLANEYRKFSIEPEYEYDDDIPFN